MSSFARALSLPSASLSCAVATYSAEAPPMHQNSPFSDKKIKKNSEEGHGLLLRPLSHWGREHPLPLGAFGVSTRAFGARTPPL